MGASLPNVQGGRWASAQGPAALLPCCPAAGSLARTVRLKLSQKGPGNEHWGRGTVVVPLLELSRMHEGEQVSV